MELLIPLGLLGLLSILALIIIYIIKPNYISKHISTTYIWKMSLRYNRKRIQSSTLTRILLFLSQVLILTSVALIFASPVRGTGEADELDVIAVIDSSASMYTQTDGETRFAHAIRLAVDLTNETASKGGNMSVILADGSPDFLARRISPRNAAGLISDLRSMLETEDLCSYGVSDIDGALELCEDVLAENSAAKIYLYTDIDYSYVPEQVNVVSVSREGEWNVGILDASAEIDEGYYALTTTIAAYGDADVTVDLHVQVVLTNGSTLDLTKTVLCENGVTNTVIFRYGGGVETTGLYYCDLSSEERFSSFRSIHVSLDEADSFRGDNSFNVYGGNKEIVRIQYVTTMQNPFFPTALGILRNIYENEWDIRVTEVAPGGDYQTSGYDFYIFEHFAPSVLPRDGVIFFSDPDSAPAGAGFTVMHEQWFNGQGLSLTAGGEHPVLHGLNPDEILIWGTREISFDDTLFEPLLYCNSLPVLLCSNRQDSKVAVMSFSLNRSNIVREYDFMLLLSNLFGYYFPSTVEKYSFEVGEEITVNARGPEIYVKEEDLHLTEFPAVLTFFKPQVLTLQQSSYYGEYPDINLYIKLPASESNIYRVEDELIDPYADIPQEEKADPLTIWFAAALVALLFVEWWLQSRESK